MWITTKLLCTHTHTDCTEKRRRVTHAQTPAKSHHRYTYTCTITVAHQNRTIAIASDFRVDRRGSGSEIAARNRKSLATFHRTLRLQCIIAWSRTPEIAAISGVRDGRRNRKNRKNRCDFSALSLSHHKYCHHMSPTELIACQSIRLLQPLTSKTQC